MLTPSVRRNSKLRSELKLSNASLSCDARQICTPRKKHALMVAFLPKAPHHLPPGLRQPTHGVVDLLHHLLALLTLYLLTGVTDLATWLAAEQQLEALALHDHRRRSRLLRLHARAGLAAGAVAEDVTFQAPSHVCARVLARRPKAHPLPHGMLARMILMDLLP